MERDRWNASNIYVHIIPSLHIDQDAVVLKCLPLSLHLVSISFSLLTPPTTIIATCIAQCNMLTMTWPTVEHSIDLLERPIGGTLWHYPGNCAQLKYCHLEIYFSSILPPTLSPLIAKKLPPTSIDSSWLSTPVSILNLSYFSHIWMSLNSPTYLRGAFM